MANNHYYRECPDCGAHNDPGEICDCQERASDFLTIGYDMSGGRDQPALIISRQEGVKINTIKMLIGDKATELYELLTKNK